MKYKSKCRFNILIVVNDELLQIRPGEVIESKVNLDSPYLILINSKKEKAKITKKEVDTIATMPKTKSSRRNNYDGSTIQLR